MALTRWHLLAVVTLLLTQSAIVFAAQPYRVLGSFQKEQGARTEGMRIVGSTDIEVFLLASSVNSITSFRLLAPAFSDEVTSRHQLEALAAIGVTGVWTMRVDPDAAYLEPLLAALDANELLLSGGESDFSDGELEDIDALLAGYDDFEDAGPSAGSYLVAGAYGLRENAEAAMRLLGPLTHRALIQPAQVDGAALYRILVGPVGSGEEGALRVELDAVGVRNVWMIRDSVESMDVSATVPSAAADMMALPPQQAGTQQARKTARDQPVEYESDFNLARLKRRESDRRAK